MFTLEAAVPADAETLAQIHADAFATERVTMLKSIDLSYVHYQEMLPPIKYWIENATLIKAVDSSTNTILGWACWRMSANASTNGSIPEPEAKDFPRTPLGIGKFTGAHMGYWQNTLVPTLLPSPHRILISITIDPRYQRSGVGGALLKWGLQDKLPVWVHASEIGYPFFQSHGFEVKASLTLELKDWAQNAPVPTGYSEWGTTTFRYMVHP
ncbi:hypothetical protein THRCLA_21686 [Thraustotheca clavata]|uniref:Uncharacterized protein n=1 Tax=Thraustotheca clavata TaxID=74557 RepID=A0A1V9ZQW0_9STRA|nr:hypothetical protein THRCLA_21686 [Thraustotheca clavata]